MKESENESRSVVSDSLQPHGLYSPQNSPGQNIGVGNLSLLQRIFPIWDRTQVSHIAGRFFTSWATGEAPCILPDGDLKRSSLFPVSQVGSRRLSLSQSTCCWGDFQGVISDDEAFTFPKFLTSSKNWLRCGSCRMYPNQRLQSCTFFARID